MPRSLTVEVESLAAFHGSASREVVDRPVHVVLQAAGLPARTGEQEYVPLAPPAGSVSSQGSEHMKARPKANCRKSLRSLPSSFIPKMLPISELGR